MLSLGSVRTEVNSQIPSGLLRIAWCFVWGKRSLLSRSELGPGTHKDQSAEIIFLHLFSLPQETHLDFIIHQSSTQ